MRKNILEKPQRSGASFAGISDTKVLPQNYITLDELAREVMPLLSRYVPNTTVEIQAFTGLDVKDLSGSMRPLRNPYYKSLSKSLRSEGNGNKLTKFAIRNLSLRSLP
jgi:hypothetical protein